MRKGKIHKVWVQQPNITFRTAVIRRKYFHKATSHQRDFGSEKQIN
jgi:hypothetical protein